MTVLMPRKRVIEEYHSGDLTANCPREVFHRHRGEFEPLMQTALYRGSFAGKVLEVLHNAGAWANIDVAAAGIIAIDRIKAEIKAEGRVLSDAVKENRKAIHEEAIVGVQRYVARFAERFHACKHIGCELPLRWTHNGTRFASHTDLIVRDTENVFGRGKDRLLVFDFKWRQDSPTIDFLARWKQGMLYCLGTKYGETLIDGFWTPLDAWPAICWLHMPHLKVYQKKTATKDDQGQPVTFLKGEARPDNSVLRWVPFKEDRAADMIDEIMTKVAMYESGLFPMNPTPVGCFLCPSREWCDSFIMEKAHE